MGTTRAVRPEIRRFHEKTGCVLCGSHSDLHIDHKNDLYNDKRVLVLNTQEFSDFQCLCTHCNLQKRQVCKKTMETGKRYGIRNIKQYEHYKKDFIEGDETFDPTDINAMKGTYWHDPVKFQKTYAAEFGRGRGSSCETRT